jgi:hypothetical protein
MCFLCVHKKTLVDRDSRHYLSLGQITPHFKSLAWEVLHDESYSGKDRATPI